VVTTGGGGGDPGVDHLSLATIATPNWQTGSSSGAFLDYHVEPAPGTVAVVGLAGILAARRRRTN
jgi:MYXO-CTERM domain-containing protein